MFRNYEIILDYQLQGESYNIMNVARRNVLPEDIKNDTNLFFYYIMKESDTPLIMADKLYDKADDHWIFLVFNDRFDLYNDWPLDSLALQEYIERTYEDINAIHHYESIATGAIVDSDHATYDLLPVTNYEYEVRVNDQKRLIKVVKPEHVGLIKSYFK